MEKTLSAGVLLIGDELLSGSIEDQNLAHIAVTLEERGIRVRETRIVPDIEQDIVEALNALRARYDYVFTTGGIGQLTTTLRQIRSPPHSGSRT